MVKRIVLFFVIAIVCISLTNGCSEEFNEDRIVIINVNYTVGTVDETNNLWAVVFGASDWTSELFRLSSSTTQIVIPLTKKLHMGNFVAYIAIVHDSNGDGVLTGERSIGYDAIQPSNTLSPVALLEIKTLVLNIDLDSTNAGPFP